MLATALAATPWGIEARPVEVEAFVRPGGLPQLHLVGLPDAAVRESRDRVQSAIKNCGIDLESKSSLINLAPADLRKEGNHLDLAIALALLAGHDVLPRTALAARLFCGELGLDGQLRPIRGGLAIARLGRRLGLKEVLVPRDNAPQAAALGDVPVIPLGGLTDAIEHLLGIRPIPPAPATPPVAPLPGGGLDLADVRGQETAKRVLEVAAAGGHNLLMVGPPGSGKTMLARCLPALLPPLTLNESILVTLAHSLVSAEPLPGLVSQRPFRSPHPGISTAALIGGGSVPRPGEVSLAHAGILFLDELPEFRRDALEALRQPLEEGSVTVVRTRGRCEFPARFGLVAAMNPCPCGHLGDPRNDCRCTPAQIQRYRQRISGPLLDRIDLQIEVPTPSLEDLQRPPTVTSREVAARVHQARRAQLERFGRAAGSPCNAALGPRQLERYTPLTAAGRRLLDSAFERLGLSARALNRVLKVSRTLADLAEREEIEDQDVAEAIQYRSLDLMTDEPLAW